MIINIINKDLVEIFKLIEQYDEEGKNLIKLIEEVILFFKNLIICQNINDYVDENISREIYEDLINKISTKELLEIIMKINNALIEMKKYGNPKMIFELLVISLVSNKEEITEQHIENQQLNEKKKENKNLNEEESINNSEDNIEILKKIKEIRINNTFSGASRSELNKVKKEIMGRERNRIAKQREKNAVVECNKIQKKYYPELFTRFAEVLDPRNGSYIDYSIKEMLGTVYYKEIGRASCRERV